MKPTPKKPIQQKPDYNHVELVDDPNVRSGEEWAKHGGNFPVMRNGHVYYVSRSICVSLYCYAKNAAGEWCVLANKRGAHVKTSQNMWNVPTGYLDYGETTEQAAAREAYEETGVAVPVNLIQQVGMNSSVGPHSKTQNVSIRYRAILNRPAESYKLTSEHSEVGEVAAIAWVPLTKVKTLDWMGHQMSNVFAYAKGLDGNTDVTQKISDFRQKIAKSPILQQQFDEIIQLLTK